MLAIVYKCMDFSPENDNLVCNHPYISRPNSMGNAPT